MTFEKQISLLHKGVKPQLCAVKNMEFFRMHDFSTLNQLAFLQNFFNIFPLFLYSYYSRADKSSFSPESCKKWYKQQIWHIDG